MGVVDNGYGGALTTSARAAADEAMLRSVLPTPPMAKVPEPPSAYSSLAFGSQRGQPSQAPSRTSVGPCGDGRTSTASSQHLARKATRPTATCIGEVGPPT